MSLPEADPIVSYTGNASTSTPYQFPYKVLEAAHLEHYVDGVLSTDAITFTGYGLDAGGSITTSVAYTSSQTVTFKRVVEYKNDTVLTSGGRLKESSLEGALDYMTMQAQQLATDQRRAITVPNGETAGSIPVRASRASKIAGYDANGDPIASTAAEVVAAYGEAVLNVDALSKSAQTLTSGEKSQVWANIDLVLNDATMATASTTQPPSESAVIGYVASKIDNSSTLVQFISSSSASTGTGSSLSVTKPSDVEEGDFLVMFGIVRNATLPSRGPTDFGWAEIYKEDIDSDDYLVAYRKEATASEPSSYTLNFTSTGIDGIALTVVALRGVDPRVVDVTYAGLTNTAASIPEHEGGLVLSHYGTAFSTTKAYQGVPNPFVEIDSVHEGTSDVRQIIGRKTCLTSSTLAATEVIGNVDAFNAAAMISFRPAGGIDAKSFLEVSDVHVEYAQDGLGGTDYAGGLERFEETMDSVLAIGTPPVAICNGDFWDEGVTGTSTQGKADANTQKDRLDTFWLFAAGNHDPAAGTSDFDPTTAEMSAFYDSVNDTELTTAERERGYYTRVKHGITHLVINTAAKMAPSEGNYELGSTQKTWITTELGTITGSTRRLVVHSHVDPTNTDSLYFRLTSTDREFLQGALADWVVTTGGKLLACMTAHRHGIDVDERDVVSNAGGVYYVQRVDGYDTTDRTANVKSQDFANTKAAPAICTWVEETGVFHVYGMHGSDCHRITPQTPALLTSILGFWDCESPTASTLEDIHGTNDLTKTGTPTSVTGKIGNGAGKTTTAYWQGARAFTADITEFSGAFWGKVATRTGTNDSAILSQYNSTGDERGFCCVLGNGASTGNTDDNFRVFLSGDGTGIDLDYRVNELVDDGTWHHYAFTFKDGTLKLYMDGLEKTGSDLTKSADTAITSVHDSTEGLEIGAVNGGSTYVDDCEIDEVGLWSRELTALEIRALYKENTYAEFTT